MPSPSRPTLRAILLAACEVHRVTEADVFGRSRNREVTEAKRLYAAAAHQLTIHSWPQIARGIGRRSHSGVWHAWTKFCDWEVFERLRRMVEGGGS